MRVQSTRRASLFFLSLALSAALAHLAACHGRERVVAVQLDAAVGDGGLGPFGAVRPIDGLLDATDALQDPTLSADELEMYFASAKSGTLDIWRSTRTDVGQPWPRATRVDELSTADRDLEPWLANDGLTIYVAQDLGATVQIFAFHRASRAAAWGQRQVVPLGDPPTTTRGPTVDRMGHSMVFASDRLRPDFDLYQTTRVDAASPWSAPLPLFELNTAWHDWDANLFLDGLALAFGSRRDGDHLTTDLYEVRRPSASAAFAQLTPLTALNSPASEGDPWISNDGHHVVFSSDRDGFSRLYEARR